MAIDKAVDSAALNAVFTDIADAIRAKSGGSAVYAHSEMATAIGGLPVPSDMNALIEGTSTEVSSIVATKIKPYLLCYCEQLTRVNFPLVTTVGQYAFWNARNLTDVNLPAAVTIGTYAFSYCWGLRKIRLPSATTLGSSAFESSSGVKTIDLAAVTTIQAKCFQYSGVESLILRTNAVASLSNVNALTGTSIANGTGYIYVPRVLMSNYRMATNWATYAAQLRAIEDYPDVCGTT